ncbi:MAG: hypothetical protein RL122_2805, partial [Pseudomonadota bacterium]
MNTLKTPITLLLLGCALTACGGSSTSTSTTTTDTTATDTTTNSGSTLTVTTNYDQVVSEGTNVTLVATASDSSATYAWTQTTGTAVTLGSANTSVLSFAAPSVATTTTLTFKVTASTATGTSSKDVNVEVWKPVSTTDATALGDFSGKSGWSCTEDLRDKGYTSNVTSSTSTDTITYTSNAIPAHAIGTFPNAGNPNTATPQSLSGSIPRFPQKQSTPTDVKNFGFTLDGVTFDRNTAECYNNETACNWRYEAITPGIASGKFQFSWLGTDCNNGHVQPTGNYHYHGLPESLINKLGDTGKKMTQVGYAADGFPIYARWGYSNPLDTSSALKKMTGSYKLKSGTRPSGPGGTYDGTFVQDWQYVAASGDL